MHTVSVVILATFIDLYSDPYPYPKHDARQRTA